MGDEAGLERDDAVELRCEGGLARRGWRATVGFEIAIELPDRRADGGLGEAVVVREGVELVNQPPLSWLCENSTRYKRTSNFEACGHAQSKKTQKFVLSSAIRPNQISFSHSLFRGGRAWGEGNGWCALGGSNPVVRPL